MESINMIARSKKSVIVASVILFIVLLTLYRGTGHEKTVQETVANNDVVQKKNSANNDVVQKKNSANNDVVQKKNSDLKDETILMTMSSNKLSEFKFPDKLRDYKFNINRSLEVPVDRILPSTVPKECSTTRDLHNNEFNISVVIPFHAEHYTVLLRLLHSVLNTVPDAILHEIILIDDANFDVNLEQPLDEYINIFPKISVIRLIHRQGLIRARMEGARAATGDVLVFIDAHVEVEQGWIEPLLQVIAKDRTTVAVPHILALDPNTLQPMKAGKQLMFGSFLWTLDYFWRAVPDPKDDLHSSPNRNWNQLYANINPIPSATMIGCTFAVHRESFFHLGGLDEGMEVWGGENLELSFRAWMCGSGGVVLVPCSRTYHIFRTHLPYPVGDSMYKNLQRVALVWLGEEYKEFYFQTIGKTAKFTDEDKISLDKRFKLKDELKCRNFSWYLHNVAKNIMTPPRLAVIWGQFKNVKLSLCLESSPAEGVQFTPCPNYTPSQIFYFNTDSQIVHQSTGTCLAITRNVTLTLTKCQLFQKDQTWNLNPIYPDELKPYIVAVDINNPIGSFWIRNQASKNSNNNRMCLDFTREPNPVTYLPSLIGCDMMTLNQYWVFSHKINDHISSLDV